MSIAKGLQLLHVGRADSSFRMEDAPRGRVEIGILLGMDIATGQRPAPRERLGAAPHQQHLQMPRAQGQDNDVDCHQRRPKVGHASSALQTFENLAEFVLRCNLHLT
jgi:hypothetical protein